MVRKKGVKKRKIREKTYVWFNVLVLDVERLCFFHELHIVEQMGKTHMFPDVDTNDWNMRKQRVLVGSGDNLKLLSRRVPPLELIVCVWIAIEKYKGSVQANPNRSLELRRSRH